jgi:polyisoprenoid-binding protein YceI
VGRVTVGAGSYRLGPAAGRVSIRTSRAGLAARAGHDLLIEFGGWSAVVTVPDGNGDGDGDGDLAATTITAELDLASLAVREGTGGARPLTGSDRADIERTMRKILGGGTATFTSSRIIPSTVGGAVEGTLSLNGRSQPVRFQVRNPAPGRYRGSGPVIQTAFGITPYTGFFGALKLKDEVTAEFDVDLGKAT